MVPQLRHTVNRRGCFQRCVSRFYETLKPSWLMAESTNKFSWIWQRHPTNFESHLICCIAIITNTKDICTGHLHGLIRYKNFLFPVIVIATTIFLIISLHLLAETSRIWHHQILSVSLVIIDKNARTYRMWVAALSFLWEIQRDSPRGFAAGAEYGDEFTSFLRAEACPLSWACSRQ
jgi:hypothetical protein